MKNGVRTGFHHREKSPISYDSICLKCFRTVSSQKTEDELGKYENNHVCEREILPMPGDIKLNADFRRIATKMTPSLESDSGQARGVMVTVSEHQF
jgi:hypothetical protein